MLEFQAAQLALNEAAVRLCRVETRQNDARNNYWPPEDQAELRSEADSAKSALILASYNFTAACDQLTKERD